ncbi:MAG: nucleotidyl transferase AbiEii/AbiGii toxin family protein [Eubacteriales bacterium]|nr:nucleotidyl transferase AbiEii/AbiGii toxin family protein [Eubacteriales bacterium]
MLLRENYTAEHISKLREETGADPSMLERTVFAFGLLEAIRSVGMPFVFKGGTSLLLLLKEPRRLSTDIDIIVDRDTDIDGYIEKAGRIFPFINVKEHKRKGANDIEKRHFRFHFLSPGTGKEISILLDVVFENNPYPKVMERPIRSRLLLSREEDLTVSLPDKNCILGDKLTAFAPHTTGIPFGIDKELEIIKQLFDCWTLLQEMDDYRTTEKVYHKVSHIELGYRGLDSMPPDCLEDTIDSCICILGRGSIRPKDYANFSAGINAIQGHIFAGRINGENAGVYASEVMYLAACLRTGQTEYKRITDPDEYRNIQLQLKGIKKISSIRNTNPLAYAYVIKSLQLLNESGLYTESVL